MQGLPEEWVALLDSPEIRATYARMLTGPRQHREIDLAHARSCLWQTLLTPFPRKAVLPLRCHKCRRLLDHVSPSSSGITSDKHGGGVAGLATATVTSSSEHRSLTYICRGRHAGSTIPINTERLAAAFVTALRIGAKELLAGAPRFGLPSAALVLERNNYIVRDSRASATRRDGTG